MREPVSEPLCPVCGDAVVLVEARMAEMSHDPETRTRIWRRIGRIYHHVAGSACDEVLAEARDVVR